MELLLSSLLLLHAMALQVAGAIPMQIKLVQDLLDKYDKKAKPIWDNSKPINVSFSMDLYQILELNEPQQYILLNAWIIERWYDEFLYWNPDDYNNITELRLPYDTIWLPDTTLYNSLVMKDDDTRRLLNAKVTTERKRRAALIELLYPTIYKFSCLLNLRFFPFDVQECTMTFSSWTYDQMGIDYFPYSHKIGTSNYLENEGWFILETRVLRTEVKYKCCPSKYTLLQLTLHLRRKPLFYIVNLIIPTSIITLIAIVGFFTTSSASGMREEKVSLGITTLLSMSILMLMVSDQMPTTSTFIPLIGWFILAMIVVISLGTIVSSVIIAVQKRGRLGERLSRRTVKLGRAIAYITCTSVPPHLLKEMSMESETPLPTASNNVESRPLSTQEPKFRAPAPPIYPDSVYRASKVWLGLRHRPANGVSLVSEKSTDPLIHLSPSENNASLADAAGAGSSTAPVQSPTSPPPMPLAPPATHDDDLSMTSDVSRPPTTRANSNRPTAAASVAAAVRQTRQMAQTEYEWLATVMERACFALFVTAFLFITVGINCVGFVHWYAAGLETDRRLAAEEAELRRMTTTPDPMLIV